MLNLDIEIPLEDPETKIGNALHEIRPDWNLKDVTYKIFSGGLANKVIGCVNRLTPKDIVLFKIHGPTSDLLRNNEREKFISKFLYRIGLTAPFYGTFKNGLIYAYTHGTLPTIDECLSPSVGSQIAAMLTKFHRSHPPILKCEPFLWKAMEIFVQNLPESFTDENIQKRYNSLLPKKEHLIREMNWLRGVIEELNSPIVFSHNDLSRTNVIYNKKRDHVSFIDFEMAYYNYQGFDFGNFFAFNLTWGTEAKFRYATDDDIREWLKVYLKYLDDGDQSDARIELLLKHTRYFHMASHLLWGFWSITQIGQTMIDYDHLGYAQCRLNGFYEMKTKLFPDLLTNF